MPPHPDQPGLEVNDSPGLEVVVPTYESQDPKHRAAYQGLGHQGVDYYSPENYHNSQRAPSYPQQTYQVRPNYQQAYFPGSASEQAIYQGSDKETVPGQFPKQQKRILGLPVLWLWILISLILIGSIAGGVGGGFAAKNSRSSAEQAASPLTSPSPSPTSPTITSPPSRSNPSSTTTTSSPPKSTTTTTITNTNTPSDGGCPATNGTTFTPRSPSTGQQIPIANLPGLPPQSFTRLCNTNYPSGVEYGNPGLSDISKVWAPTLDDCVRLCAEYNAMFNVSGAAFNYSKGFCRSVAIVERENEFCYLKNGTGKNITNGAPGDFAGAVLVQDPTL